MRETLGELRLFQSLPLDGLTRLAEQGRPRRFPVGSQLLRQGEHGDSLFIIVQGRVRVERSHPHLLRPVLLAELGPGEVVGEIGVLDGEPRTATVTALKETDTIELGTPALTQTIVDHPEVGAALLRVLSRRLRTADELLEHLAAKDPMRSRPDSSIPTRRAST